MLIHGRDIHFMLTCGASAEISKLCPNNDLSRMGELFADSSDLVKMLDVIGTMAVALNKGYEMNQKFIAPGYEPNPITFEEVMTLTVDELAKLQDELINVMVGDLAGEVEVEPPKGKKNETPKQDR